jgi:phage terminase large subunit-like protein
MMTGTDLVRPRTVAERLALLPREERARLLAGMTEAQLTDLRYDWKVWARPKQLAPGGEWNHWGLMWGRGAGKTRSAAEWFRSEIESGRHQFTHLVGRSAGDTRKVMIEGESGLLAICHPNFFPEYKPGTKRLVWPNGAITLLFNATEPEELRGPQCSLYWADEIAAWKRATETWDNLMFGFRLGVHPRGVFTTTPRPIKLMRDLVKNPNVIWAEPASTYENVANLATTFVTEVLQRYEGTRLARQEIMGELLLDMPGALWTVALIDDERVQEMPDIEEFSRIVVAIDPAVTSGEEADETGLVVVGRDRRKPAHYYVLRDLSGRWTANEWARKAVAAYHNLDADRIVAETNNGGDLVENTIRVVDPNVAYKKVTASRGKYIRGEPVAALYDQRRVHHVGLFPELEDEMVTFLPDDERRDGSPSRADALIWALTELKDVFEPSAPPASFSQQSYR